MTPRTTVPGARAHMARRGGPGRGGEHPPAGADHRTATDGPGAAPAITGAASAAIRPVLEGPRREARVLAAFPLAAYLELSGTAEPRVLALVAPAAVRLPNALLLADAAALRLLRPGLPARVGGGTVRCGPVHARAARWWAPRPVLPPVTPDRLDAAVARMAAICAASPRRPGLAGHDGPDALAACCTADDLAGAVQQAERVVGLGPGLTPSGDDVLCGLLLALRLMGDAVRRAGSAGGGDAAVRLADWIGAAVTSDAGTRTTALSATLLHCAVAGQCSGEATAVLRAMSGPADGAGQAMAARRLLTAGHTSGADLAWGITAGCRAVAALARNVRRAA